MHRIGYLTFSVDRKNGLGRFSRELLLRVAERGHRAIVLTYHRDEVDDEIASIPELEIRRVLPSHYDLGRLWTNLRWGARVARELEGCDFIHSIFDFPHTELAARASRKLEIPYVASAIGTYSIAPLHSKRHAGRMGVALLEAYRVIAISSYTLAEVEKRLPLPNATVVPLGIDAEQFAGDITGTPPTDRFDLIGVGALKDRKGWDLVVRAVAELRELDPPVHATIVGGMAIGDAAERYQRLAEELGVSDRVHFPGQVSDDELKRLYASSHLYVMPARSDHHKVEGFGLVYLEAGAFGLPQVGTVDSGATEPIAHGETGMLVPQNDPAAVAQAIRELHGDPERLKRMGEAALARARAMSWDATVDGILACYPREPKAVRRRRPSTHRRMLAERWPS